MAGKKSAPKAPQVKLAEKIAKKLVAIDGVVAVTLGGSWARGKADKSSDVDLGVYYRAQQKPHLDHLRALAREIDESDPPAVPTDFGEWGPWINGGAWLTVSGTRVDWIYRELEHVVQTLSDCRAGRVTVDYQAGHPHGFHNHIYMAEIALGVVLADPTGMLGKMQELARAYPDGLKRGIVERHLWEASFSLDTVAKSAKREDVAHVAGCVYRSAAALVQVLFALNGAWFTNEKGSVDATRKFELAPKRFADRVEGVLGKTGTTASALAKSVEEMRALVDETHTLTEKA
ncbi:MAG TPA: nucleotidyltransferase domain-containing protein [bacterium]|nr:nucleotidyltransferase domain-containing protein [bacterium]